MTGGPRRGAAGPLVGFAVVSGVAVAAQSRINATLAVRLQDAVLAALVSFATGLLLVGIVVGVAPAARRSVRGPRLLPVRWWYFVGGVGGASAVTASTAVVPRVGVAAFTVVIVSGQVVGGLLVDRAGLGPGGRRAVSRPRVGAAALAVGAVLVAAAGHGGAGPPVDAPVGTTGPAWPIPLLLTLSALAGMAVSAQQAVNARLRLATGRAMVATLANFVGGTVSLALVYWLTVTTGVPGAPTAPGAGTGFPIEPWLYLGGPIGVAYIALNSVIIPVIGVLRQSIAVLVGMLSGAVVLDVVVPAAEMPPFAATAASVALAAVAVWLVAWEGRRPAGHDVAGHDVAGHDVAGHATGVVADGGPPDTGSRREATPGRRGDDESETT